MDELIPLVEPTGLVYGMAPRAWVHGGEKPLHPVVHLHIIDRQANIYLQKRSMTKDLLPGYWDTAVGGHVAYGETALEAIYRETQEELGLTAINPVLIENYIWESATEREMVFVFAFVGHPEIHPDGEEVTQGQWIPTSEIESHFGKNRITPNFEQEYVRIKKKLIAML